MYHINVYDMGMRLVEDSWARYKAGGKFAQYVRCTSGPKKKSGRECNRCTWMSVFVQNCKAGS